MHPGGGLPGIGEDGEVDCLAGASEESVDNWPDNSPHEQQCVLDGWDHERLDEAPDEGEGEAQDFGPDEEFVGRGRIVLVSLSHIKQPHTSARKILVSRGNSREPHTRVTRQLTTTE